VRFQRCVIGWTLLACALGVVTSVWARDLTAHAPLGRTVRVWGSVNFTHHCSTAIETTITVTEPPAHGSVSIRDEIVKQNSPDFGSCGGQSSRGEVVYYT
jgi:predicted outer membrane lipoprotein